MNFILLIGVVLSGFLLVSMLILSVAFGGPHDLISWLAFIIISGGFIMMLVLTLRFFLGTKKQTKNQNNAVQPTEKTTYETWHKTGYWRKVQITAIILVVVYIAFLFFSLARN